MPPVHVSYERAGEGTPVVLLHGLTATRRYVVMGSRALERSGHDVVAYDARGHGHSPPAPSPEAYTYADLSSDLEALLDSLGIGHAVLAGASMGAHTAIRFALEHPERVSGLVVITPAHDPDADREEGLKRWDALAEGLRHGGVEGFIGAYDLEGTVPEQWRETYTRVLQQRIGAHDHPAAVADALQAVPRSSPFEAWSDLQEIAVPTTVVASRDDADPGHPFAIGERYAQVIPGATFLTEEPGKSPLAWQGGQLSRVIADAARS